MNISNLKRWWANQCAQSATGLKLGTLIAAHKQAMEQNRELLAENRKLANAIRAIHEYELSIAANKTHEERLAWSHTYTVTCAALGISKGRAEAATAKYRDKTNVAEMAESGIQAVRTGKNPQHIHREQYWAKRWKNDPDRVAGSYREAATKYRKAKQQEKQP